MVRDLLAHVLSFLYEPKKVFFLCLGLLLFSIIVNGKIFQLLGLYQQKEKLAEDITNLTQQTSVLRMQIKEAKHMKFIEKKAVDQLDLVAEGDLIFVFSEEEPAAKR